MIRYKLALNDPQLPSLNAQDIRTLITAAAYDPNILESIGHQQPSDITFKRLPGPAKQPARIEERFHSFRHVWA